MCRSNLFGACNSVEELAGDRLNSSVLEATYAKKTICDTLYYRCAARDSHPWSGFTIGGVNARWGAPAWRLWSRHDPPESFGARSPEISHRERRGVRSVRAQGAQPVDPTHESRV